jgi:hypothetical protein
MQQQYADSKKEDPNIAALKKMNADVIDWHTGKNGVKDIYKNPLLGSSLPAFELAKMNRDKNRVGRGIAGLSTKNAGQYSEDIALEDGFERSTMASGILESGLRNQLAGAQGNLMALGGMDLQRFQAGSSVLSSMASTAGMLPNGGGWGGFFRGIVGGVAPALGALAL